MLKSNKKRAVYLLLAIVALFAAKGNDVYAQDENSNVISTGVPFLLIGPNSRFSGMGETGTAVADDATAMHWNPAGLAPILCSKAFRT